MIIIQLKNCKHYLFCSLLFILHLPISAQNSINTKEWLDKSLKIFKETESMSIFFTINVIRNISSEKVSENFDGQIDLKGNKFHLTIPDKEIWFNGKNQWILHKKLKEVNIIQSAEQDVLELNPIRIFNKYKKDCKYKDNGKKKDLNKRIIQEIELIPNQKKNENINKIVLYLNPNNFVPVKIHITFINEVESIVYINRYKKNVHFQDQYFTFDKRKYPNIEIVDLR